MPKIVDHAERRREIILGLWEVIGEHGTAGVTLQAVAAAAGVSIGRIQHYFESKRDLVLEGARQMTVMAAQAWQSHNHDEPLTQLAALVRQPVPRTEAFRLGSSVWYSYLAAAAVDPELDEIIGTAVRNGFAEATTLVAKVTGDGDGARRTAVRLMALGSGLAQAVQVGALAAEEALAVLDEELARL